MKIKKDNFYLYKNTLLYNIIMNRLSQLSKSFVRRITKRIDLRPNYVHLGRWAIDYCPERIDYKIEFANEDHCGPCGQKIKHNKLTKNAPN